MQETIKIDGFASVHSHAFQRALRARTQRRSSSAHSFWSWRGLMFHLAQSLSPQDIYNIAHFAYIELALSGVTAVGEFHYLHHQPNGTPYGDRLELSHAVIQAAKDAGIRITLIRAAYQRAGYMQTLVSGQNRFCDPQIDDVLYDLENLQHHYQHDPLVKIAVAAHSIRTVPIDSIRQLVSYAEIKQQPFHMHIAEQRRELLECQHEYGLTPVDLLAKHQLLSANFVAVHATHLNLSEISALGAVGAQIALCRTTERDLGDGNPPVPSLLQAGAKLCFGVDSYTSSDAFEEMRAAELDARTLTETRHAAAEAPELLKAATTQGYIAIGQQHAIGHDHTWLRADDPALCDAPPQHISDAIVFSGSPRAVERVSVGDTIIVDQGQHKNYHAALEAYRSTLKRLNFDQ
jgi:formimidoylglutamate deiminase